MTSISKLVFLGVTAAACAGPARAQGLHAVRPVPGYQCMSLNLSEQQMEDRSLVVPVLAGPSKGAQVVGRAPAVIFAGVPPREVNGYVQVLRFNKQTGWMEASFLKAWRNPGSSGQQCVPSFMSNGSLGIGMK